jgi:hypothetical protein
MHAEARWICPSVVQAPLDARLERAEVRSRAARPRAFQVEAVRPREEAVAIRPRRRRRFRNPVGVQRTPSGRSQRKRAVHPGFTERATAEPLGELEQDLPVGELATLALDHRRRPARDVAHREPGEKSRSM